MTRISRGHRFDLINGRERRGNTAATSRSTWIKTKLWADSRKETSAANGGSLHEVLQCGSLLKQVSRPYKAVKFHVIKIKGQSKLDNENVDRLP